MDTLKIVQHNVAHVKPYKFNLLNAYKSLDPDIILINSHGLQDTDTIKMLGYASYKINSNNERHDGSAILIKTSINHKIKDDYISDFLAVTVQTTSGPINIATTYLPPRRPYLPYPDFHNFAMNNAPSYILGDLNAKYPVFGDNHSNNVGIGLKTMIDNNLLQHLGPNFPTYFSTTTCSTPDLILGNKNIYHNHMIEQGPATASDHIPIIFTITTKKITIPTTPRYCFKNVGWELFQSTIEYTINEAVPPDQATPAQIDTSTESWFNIITNAMQAYIPKTNTITTNKAISNPTTRNIQYYINNLMIQASLSGWTQSKLRTYKLLKTILINEYRKMQQEN